MQSSESRNFTRTSVEQYLVSQKLENMVSDRNIFAFLIRIADICASLDPYIAIFLSLAPFSLLPNTNVEPRIIPS